jgi:hypothetical protein
MAERDEQQIGFRVKEGTDKEDFAKALDKQPHIGSATVFFQACMTALREASENDEQVLMPIKFETRPKRLQK